MFDDTDHGKMGDDDGLLTGQIAGGVVDLRIRISTSYSDHPEDFPPGSLLYADAWVDWDDDYEFEHPAEYVGQWCEAPPFAGSDDTNAYILGPAQGNPPGDYNVRIRLDYHNPGDPHTENPEGDADGEGDDGNSYGEVEDYYSFDLSQTFFTVPVAGPAYVSGFLLGLLILGVRRLRRNA